MANETQKDVDNLTRDINNLTKSVVALDKSMSVFLQKSEDFFLKNKDEHDSIIKSIDGNTTTLKDHNGRLRKLEKWKYGLAGGLTVVVILIGWIFNAINTFK